MMIRQCWHTVLIFSWEFYACKMTSMYGNCTGMHGIQWSVGFSQMVLKTYFSDRNFDDYLMILLYNQLSNIWFSKCNYIYSQVLWWHSPMYHHITYSIPMTAAEHKWDIPANERQHYNVTQSLFGWAHTQHDPWGCAISIVCTPLWNQHSNRSAYCISKFVIDHAYINVMKIIKLQFLNGIFSTKF